MNKIATVIGHGECYEVSKDCVRKNIIRLVGEGYTTFLFGGMGMFDLLCARVVFELKREYALRSYLVIPYLTFRNYDRDLYDDVIYPEGLERCYFKRAIVERNRYLVNSSQGALCYVVRSYGGAYQTVNYAKKVGILLYPLEKGG